MLLWVQEARKNDQIKGQWARKKRPN